MTEILSEFFVKIFGNHVELATIFISMIPIVELRGGIPFATNTDFWGKNAMSSWEALGWSLLGSCIIVPIIALIFLPIINWLKKTKLFRKMAVSIENKVKSHADSIIEKNEKKHINQHWAKIIGVFIFVSIPLPLTGVWTGTCVAVVLGLSYLTTCSTVILGNVCAGAIIALILQFFPWLNDYLFYIFIGIVIAFLLYCFISAQIKKSKIKHQEQSKNDTNINNSQQQ